MIRLQIVAEGDSEERFCKRMLIPHLAGFSVFAYVSMVTTSTMRGRPDVRFKGGLPRYAYLRKDVQNYLCANSSSDFRVTSFVDFFHLPSDFPGIKSLPDAERDVQVRYLEDALAKDIGDARFIPYIQKHEFEAFLFVDIEKLIALHPSCRAKIARIARAADGIAPEDINGGDTTSPSNRIIKEIPEHRSNKPNAVSVLEEIGLPRLRMACPHFNSWLLGLEKLAEVVKC